MSATHPSRLGCVAKSVRRYPASAAGDKFRSGLGRAPAANYRSRGGGTGAIIRLKLWQRESGPALPGCVVEAFRAGNGFEEQRLRRGQIRLQGLERGPLESDCAGALRARDRGGRGFNRRGRGDLRADRRAYRPFAQGQTHGGRCADREHGVVGRQPQACASQLPVAVRRFHRACARQGAVRSGPLWRRRPHIPHKNAGLHRACVAFVVHSPAFDPSGGTRARGFRP